MRNKKVGLVLAGGGGKGAYQIGVWKALAEAQLDPVTVAGTSVGALNGALFVQGDLAVAERMWREIRPDNVLSLDPASLPKRLVARLTNLGLPLAKLPAFLRTRGLFSQRGLERMMTEAFRPGAVGGSPKAFHVAVHDRAANQVRYLRVDGDDDRVRRMLLASAALPGIFDDVEIDGTVYTDGGWYWGLPGKNLDNNPVQPVYEGGCDAVLLVCLSRDDLLGRERFPGVKVLPIVPTADLGGVFDGVLDFSGEGAARRIDQGYRDARNLLSRLDQLLESEAAYEALWQQVARGEASLDGAKERISATETRRVDLQKSIADFNRMVLTDRLEEDWELCADLGPDLLTQANQALLTQVRRNELRLQVQDFADRNLDIAGDVADAALDAVSLLAPVGPQGRGLAEQGFFGRLLGAITGRNLAVLAQNQQALAEAQFAALTLLGHLQKRNLLGFELTVAVNNKVNWLFAEVASLGEAVEEQTVAVYRSLSAVFFKLRREVLRDRRRIDGLEDRVDQLDWLTRIGVHTWEGREYRHLAAEEKVACLVNDFYRLTGGCWNVRELLTLKQALIDVGAEGETLSAGRLLSAAVRRPELALRLTERLYRDRPPPLAPLLDAASPASRGELPTVDAARGWLELVQPGAWEAELPAYHFALEVLQGLQRAGYAPIAESTLAATKREYLDRLDRLGALAEKHGLSAAGAAERAALGADVVAFRFAVPLIGPFSAGKTTLLNAHLGLERVLLPTSLPPETAVASELHPAECEEKIVRHYLDGSVREEPLERERLTARADRLLYQELHVRSPALAAHPDLILVDMPGLGSNSAAHNQAVLNYIREGVAFVLCLDGGLTEDVRTFLRDLSLYRLDFCALLTKSSFPGREDAAALAARMGADLARLAGREVAVGAVSAGEGDIAAFRDLLFRLAGQKDEALHRRFGPRLQAQVERIRQSLTLLLNREDLSAGELAAQRRELDEKLEDLDRAVARERAALARECAGSLPEAVADDVLRVLEGERPALRRQLVGGGNVQGRIDGLVRNTFRLSLTERAGRAFDEAARRIGRYVPAAAYTQGSIEGGAGFAADLAVGEGGGLGAAVASGVATWGLGALVAGGPLVVIGGLLVGLLVGHLANKRKEQEADEALVSAFGEIVARVRQLAARAAADMEEKFWRELTARVDGVKSDLRHNIGLLEKQLKESAAEVEARRAEVQKDLASLEGLAGGAG